MTRQLPYVAGMPVEFLSDDQAAVCGVFSGPPSVAELDKLFLLDAADREPVEVTGDPYTVGAVRLFTPAVNLGSVDSLIQHPSQPPHPRPRRPRHIGISERLLRLSIGLEDPDDLWSDLDHALRAGQ